MINIEALAKPIIELLGSFGSGIMLSNGPADVLLLASEAIDSTHDLGRSGISELCGSWSGNAADAALMKAEEAQGSAVRISDRGNSISDVLSAASADVNTGFVELQGILQSFVTITVAAGPSIATPPGQIMIIGAAIEHLGRALTVVAKVRAQLIEHTASMAELTPPTHVPSAPQPTESAATSPATAPAVSGDAGSKSGSGFANSASGLMSSLLPGPMSSAMSGSGIDPSGEPPKAMPPGETGSWIAEAFAVLEKDGVDTSKIDPNDVAAMIEHESGGDPNAINLWDSNAEAGIPSKGLMQTIDPTFEAYKLPGYDNIWNPVDNIVAGVRYSIDRYGSVDNVPGIQGILDGSGYVGY